MKNRVIEKDDFLIIILHGDFECFVSKESFGLINDYTWCKEGTGYAMSRSKGKAVKMHRIIMDAKKGEFIDHINGNKLDNRLNNLRICTKHQNEFNQKVRIDNKFGYRGISKMKNGRLRATINYYGHQYHIGVFDNIDKAINEYNSYAFLLYGEYARLNKKD